MKTPFKPGTLLYPLPAVMVSCGDAPDNYNIITVAWTGIVCSDPPMTYISLRPSRLSHAIISRTREFVINLTTEPLAYATDWCGVRSGRDHDKFASMHLTPEPAQVVSAPLIAQSPLNLECQVEDIRPLGSHDMFLARIVAANADTALIDPTTGTFHLNHARPIAYSHGRYFALGERLGGFGFSVRRPHKKKKNS
ncbi:MAG: flavin reductase family protein [Bacteroidales bacterium]|nr:flavin reductase family protein [Bacteroidales bacterium]